MAKLTRDDLVKFHKTWFKPNNATLVVVGDTTLAEIKPKLEKLFKGWDGGAVPAKNISAVALRPSPAVYIIDKPDAPQSVVIGGHPAPPSADPDNIAIETMNNILGGDFVSRINMNIREDKHWSYGAQSRPGPAPAASGRSSSYAPVQSDKTKETMVEIRSELEGILGKKPITADEFDNAKNSKVLGLPGQWETMAAVQASRSARWSSTACPTTTSRSTPGRVQKLTIDDLAKAAKKTVHPDSVHLGRRRRPGPDRAQDPRARLRARSPSSTPTATSSSSQIRPFCRRGGRYETTEIHRAGRGRLGRGFHHRGGDGSAHRPASRPPPERR